MKNLQKILLLLIISIILGSCNFISKSEKTDEVYEFFRNTELQYETPAQKKYILEALNDITNLDLSEKELKQKRYEDYMGKESQWSSQELISYHFVPNDKNITLGNNFYSHLKTKRVHETIRDIILILGSNAQTYNSSEENPPYILELKNKDKQLVVYGCYHSFNPKDTMFIDIEKQLLKLNPNIVLNEGGNWPIFDTKEETILKSGEQGFVRYLCNRSKIEVKTFEPNPKQEFEFILSKYKKDEVLLMYFCRQIVQLQNNQQIDNFKIYIIGFLNNLKQSGFPIEDIESEYDEIVNSYEQVLKTEFDWKTFNPENVWPNYDNTILNTINKDISEFRDKHILELIETELNTHKVVFVIMGKDHLLKQENKIKKIFNNITDEEPDYDIIVGNNIKFDIGNVDLGKEEKSVIFTLVVTNLSDTVSVPVLSNENIYKYATVFINNKEITNPTTMGGLEKTREKDVLLKGEGDAFSWGTSVDYLKNEYGNVFTVQWKYLNIYSSISTVNIENETIERQQNQNVGK